MVNPAIAMGVKQLELPDPLAQYGKIAAIQQAQNQNALAQYQLGAAQRAEASENALNAAYQQAYDPQTGRVDVNKLRQTLATGGFGAKLPGIEKGLGELETQRLTRVKTQLDFLPRLYQQAALSADPFAAAVAIHDKVHNNPDLGPWLSSMGASPDQGLATIQAAAQKGPDAVRQLLLDSAGTVESITSRMKPIEVSASASVYDPRTGTFKQAPAAPVKATPAETEEIVLRLQDPSLPPSLRQALESRLRILTTREPKEPKADDTKVIAQTIYDPAGNPTFLNKFGQVITPTSAGGAPVKIQGKPTATHERTSAQRRQLAIDLDRTISELETVSKDGGLIDQSTGSGIGRLRDVGAAFVGVATDPAIASGKLAPIADMVLKMVPRFEGPQSDKDTQSYKEAAGQLANPTLPSNIRKNAAREITRLMKDRKGQFITGAMEAEGVGPGAPPMASPGTPSAVPAMPPPPSGFVPDSNRRP